MAPVTMALRVMDPFVSSASVSDGMLSAASEISAEADV
jgi:hypothetical protein